LNFLGRLGYAVERFWCCRHGAVHQLRFRIEGVVELGFKRVKFFLRGHWICPHPGNLPNVDLAIGYYVGSS
jgi:hypothetical protein